MNEQTLTKSPPIRLQHTDVQTMLPLYPEMVLAAGEVLFLEGSPSDCAYVVVHGELEVIKATPTEQVLLNVIGPGELVGEMGILEGRPRIATVQARTDSALLMIDQDRFDQFLESCPLVTRHVISIVLDRWRNTEARLRQQETLAQWGALTANIAHELNNPAAAVKRGAAHLQTALGEYVAAQGQMSRLAHTPEQDTLIREVQRDVLENAARPPEMDGMVRSDREAEIEAWLSDYGVRDAWEYAPVFVNLGYDTARLEFLFGQFSTEHVEIGLRWLNASYTAYSLLAEISQGAAQISTIVQNLKDYSFLDQAPVQEVSITEGLDDTLLLLRRKIGQGINVRREYAPDLPKIQAYGRELNQVWTNILDNALAAVGEQGTIVIRAFADGPDWVVVEIEDDGPGIPPEAQPHLFEAFFTTKEPGKGTGLGLNISHNIVAQKHRGTIEIESQPGRTVFRIRLPVDFEQVTGAVL